MGFYEYDHNPNQDSRLRTPLKMELTIDGFMVKAKATDQDGELVHWAFNQLTKSHDDLYLLSTTWTYWPKSHVYEIILEAQLRYWMRFELTFNYNGRLLNQQDIADLATDFDSFAAAVRLEW